MKYNLELDPFVIFPIQYCSPFLVMKSVYDVVELRCSLVLLNKDLLIRALFPYVYFRPR